MHADDLARRNFERDITENPDIAKGLADGLQADHVAAPRGPSRNAAGRRPTFIRRSKYLTNTALGYERAK
jgi:hypothetical protein